MSRTVVDDDLLEWEVYPSGGKFGLPERPYLVFTCRSDPSRRPRQVVLEGDEADAEAAVERASDEELRTLLRRSEPIP